MAKTNLSIAPSTKQEWTVDTADFFTLRLDCIRSILITLCANLDEYEPDDGRASDEAVCLAVQHVAAEILILEKLSYELDDCAGLGDLSLNLMRARALVEIIEGMFNANSFKINLGKAVLVGYLFSVKRLMEDAHEEAVDAHARRFHLNAPAVAA